MQDCKPISTPLPINFKLSSSMSPSNEAERMEMSRVPYASAVGSLMFAMIRTRLDIAQVVGAVGRYMANPGRKHWNTIKRILRYIKGTSLCYGESEFTVRGYVDSDFAGDLCCDVAVTQINYPSLKHNTQDSIDQARGQSHEEDLVQIFMLYVMQLGGFDL